MARYMIVSKNGDIVTGEYLGKSIEHFYKQCEEKQVFAAWLEVDGEKYNYFSKATTALPKYKIGILGATKSQCREWTKRILGTKLSVLTSTYAEDYFNNMYFFICGSDNLRGKKLDKIVILDGGNFNAMDIMLSIATSRLPENERVVFRGRVELANGYLDFGEEGVKI